MSVTAYDVCVCVCVCVLSEKETVSEFLCVYIFKVCAMKMKCIHRKSCGGDFTSVLHIYLVCH